MDRRYSTDRDQASKSNPVVDALLLGLAALVALGFVAGIIGGGAAGVKAFNRWQRVADARNEIEVNRMRIFQTEQLVEIERQRAAIRIEEAHGIAEAQRIIDSSLTDNYLRYLAIEAQREMAQSPNHTAVYLPIGPSGIPLVKEVTE